MTSFELPPPGWLPVAFEGRWVRFKDFGDRSIDVRNYQNWVAATPAVGEKVFNLESLALIPPGDAVPPSGFIFHMSRCGSTLIANALSRIRGNVVVNEPAMLMHCLWGAAEMPETARMHLALARGLMARWGARRTGQEQRLFVKLTPFDVLFVPLLRKAFPGVPWIFLSREPVEVMVSVHRKAFAIALSREREAFAAGISVPELAGKSHMEVFAHTIGNYCDAASRAAAPGGAFLDYADLSPDSMFSILTHFGIRTGADELNAAGEAFKLHAKDLLRQAPWIPDTDQKQREATAEIRDGARRFARRQYQQVRILSRTPGFSLLDRKISGRTVPPGMEFS